MSPNRESGCTCPDALLEPSKDPSAKPQFIPCCSLCHEVAIDDEVSQLDASYEKSLNKAAKKVREEEVLGFVDKINKAKKKEKELIKQCNNGVKGIRKGERGAYVPSESSSTTPAEGSGS